MKERHVQAIWYDGRLRPKNLFTRRGESVNVISPGEWNSGAGPDFRRAVLEIGREHRRIAGDVEVHLCPSDWDLHGHGSVLGIYDGSYAPQKPQDVPVALCGPQVKAFDPDSAH